MSGPKDHPMIGTKLVFRNKLDESRVGVRSKAKLVVKGYNQEEGIDFNETLTPIARSEAICIILAFPSHTSIKIF